jgi:uncharacterized protein YdcH (DUF465 family)
VEAGERERLTALSSSNAEVRYLLARHEGLERDLTRLEAVRYPTEDERRDIQRIKRLKLRGKDRLQSILAGA